MKDFRQTIVSLVDELQKSPKGKVIFTFLNKETENHRTFKICKSDFADGKIVVSLLTGGDNTFNYTSFGFLDPITYRVSIWKKFQNVENYPKYGRIIERMFTDLLPEKLVVSHSGKCFKCGRTLTTPESIESGIGPVCADSW